LGWRGEGIVSEFSSSDEVSPSDNATSEDSSGENLSRGRGVLLRLLALFFVGGVAENKGEQNV